MTFDEVKTAILHELRRRPQCDGPAFHDASIATNFDELIIASRGFLNYLYKIRVAGESILDEFDPMLLASYGIYYKVTDILSIPPDNPYAYFDSYEIWIMKDSDITISHSDSLKYKINVFDSTLALTVDNSSYVELNMYNAQGTITVKGTSIVYSEVQNIDPLTVHMIVDEDGYMQLYTRTLAIITMDTLGNGYCWCLAKGKSIINSNLAEQDLEILRIRVAEGARVNYLPV